MARTKKRRVSSLNHAERMARKSEKVGSVIFRGKKHNLYLNRGKSLFIIKNYTIWYLADRLLKELEIFFNRKIRASELRPKYSQFADRDYFKITQTEAVAYNGDY